MPADRCPMTRKVTYLSRTSADIAAERSAWHGEEFAGMQAYVCAHFPHWHIGHPFKTLKAKGAYRVEYKPDREPEHSGSVPEAAGDEPA